MNIFGVVVVGGIGIYPFLSRHLILVANGGIPGEFVPKTRDVEKKYKGDEKEETMEKPKLQLSEQDGNVYSIIGKAIRVARKAGWSKEKIGKFTVEVISGDYDHALQTCMEHFDVC